MTGGAQGLFGRPCALAPHAAGIAGIAKTQLGNLVGPSMQEELTSVSTVDPVKVDINISEQEYLKRSWPPRG